MKELLEFRDDVRRDVLADAMGTRSPTVGRDTLDRIVQYGNAYLRHARMQPEHRDQILWFAISFGVPVSIGLTWAYNPRAPRDARFQADFFWRLWSEVEETDGVAILTRVQAEQELAHYAAQQL